jgi:hypothetical protein
MEENQESANCTKPQRRSDLFLRTAILASGVFLILASFVLISEYQSSYSLDSAVVIGMLWTDVDSGIFLCLIIMAVPLLFLGILIGLIIVRKSDKLHYVKILSINYHLFLLAATLIVVNLVLVFVNFFFLLFLDHKLTSFDNRSIGVTVLNGIDVDARITLYITLISLSFLLFFNALICTRFVDIRLKLPNVKIPDIRFISQHINKIEADLLINLVLFFFVSILLYCFFEEPFQKNISFLLLFLIGLVSLIVILRLFNKNRGKYGQYLELFSNRDILLLGFFLPVTVFFIYWITFKGNFILSIEYYIWYLALWVLFFSVYYLFLKFSPRFGLDRTILDRSISLGMIPLMLIPISVPISNELQFTLSDSVKDAQNISFTIMLMLLLISLLLFVFSRKIAFNVNRNLIETVHLPIVIATISVYKFYQPFIAFSNGYDLFHHGELLISNQQLFSFGKLPFFNIYPTHGLFEMNFQVLYSLLNGYGPVEPLLFGFTNQVIAALIFYFLLRKVTEDPIFALLAVCASPLLGIANFGYAFIILPGFTLVYALKKGGLYAFALHWSMVVLTILWRLDLGIPVAIGSILVVFVVAFSKLLRKDSIGLRRIIQSSLIPLVFISLISFIVITSVALLIHESPLDILKLNIIFTTYQGDVMSYVDILPNQWNMILALTQYLLLPIVSIFYIFIFTCTTLIERREFAENQMILVSIAIFSLGISFRSIQRHCLYEGFHPYLIILLLMLLLFYLEPRRKNASKIFFTVVLLVSSLILVDYNPLPPGGQLFKFHNWDNKESRLIDEHSQYYNITRFINENLEKNQTFYEFSNAPILYVFSNRVMLSYFIPTLYQTSDFIQNEMVLKLKEAHNKGDIKYVIFKRSSGWDDVDSVPNEIRSYKIAEFIYDNYTPLGYVDNFQVWVSKKINSDNEVRINKTISNGNITILHIDGIEQNFNLEKLPYIWGTFDSRKAVANTKILKTISENITLMDNSIQRDFPFEPDFDKSSGNYIHIRVLSPKEATLSLQYSEGGYTSGFSFQTVPSDRYEDYLIRASSQWLWISRNISSIRIKSSNYAKIEKIFIRKGD